MLYVFINFDIYIKNFVLKIFVLKIIIYQS